MFQLDAVEVVGYVASVLVVVSLAMTSVVRLRMISLAGSVAFVAYGVLIESIPILLTNAAIAVINVWFLRAELGHGRDLGASQIDATSPFLVDFVTFHLPDIHRFQPNFTLPAGDEFCLLLTRDGLPAGAVVGRREDDRLHIDLDYVMSAYRDSRLGQWIYGSGAKVFRAAGIETLVSKPGNEQHRTYLERVGFVRTSDGDGDVYVRRLDEATVTRARTEPGPEAR